MTDERLLCGLSMLASAAIIASVLSRSPEPEEVEPTPVPVCSWENGERCCTQPPRLEVVRLAALRDQRRWGSK